MTVRGARRSSTATGYLKRARARPNLRVLTGALVERIVIEGGRAASVRFRRGGRACHAVARREVILAGGAIASPQRSEEHTSELQSLMRNSYAVFCLKKKKKKQSKDKTRKNE